MKLLYQTCSLLLAALLCCGYGGVQAQTYYNKQPEFIKANSQWVFGNKLGLDFNMPGIDAYCTKISTVHPSIAWEGVASVADPATGTLLFYTDGRRCWNRNHDLMDTSYFNGDIQHSTTQGVCIVPMIDSPGKYYVFILTGRMGYVYYPPPYPGYLYYAVVDMGLNNGLGGISAPNILLDTVPLSEAMIAIPDHCGGIWLVVHHAEEAQFRAWHITASGIATNPVVSVTGTRIQGNATITLPFVGARTVPAYATGGMTVSPDRRKIALANVSPDRMFNGVLLCKFDPATGMASDAVLVDSMGLTSYCAAFSPDNTRLYLSNESYNPNNLARPVVTLNQYTVSVYDSSAIAGSRVILDTVDNYRNTSTSYFRLYDGKIYVSATVDSFLSVIHDPNQAGLACNYQSRAISVVPVPRCPPANNYNSTEITTGHSLPTEVVYPFYAPDTIYRLMLDTMICLSPGESFPPMRFRAGDDFSRWQWDDGSTDSIRTITAPGVYWVRHINEGPCGGAAIDTYAVGSAAIPDFSLGEDRALCGDGLTLEPGIAADSYTWSDGSRGSTLYVAASGTYWVRAGNGDGHCTAADTIHVTIVTPSPQSLGDDIVLCKGDPVAYPLQADVRVGAEVQWSNGSREPSVTADTAGVWWVTVTDTPCVSSDTLRITAEICACFFEVPAAFSPNGDGRNDVFRPVIEAGCPVADYRMHVYNRYGQRVFSSSHHLKGWDGLHNGAPAGIGVYFYELSFEGGTKQRRYGRKGDVTLVR